MWVYNQSWKKPPRKPSWEASPYPVILARAAPAVPLGAVVGGSLAGGLVMVALSVMGTFLLLQHRRTRLKSCRPGNFEALGTNSTGARTGSSAISDELRRAAFHIKVEDIVVERDERSGPVLLGKGSFGEARASAFPRQCNVTSDFHATASAQAWSESSSQAC